MVNAKIVDCEEKACKTWKYSREKCKCMWDPNFATWIIKLGSTFRWETASTSIKFKINLQLLKFFKYFLFISHPIDILSVRQFMIKINWERMKNTFWVRRSSEEWFSRVSEYESEWFSLKIATNIRGNNINSGRGKTDRQQHVSRASNQAANIWLCRWPSASRM